MIIPVIVHQVFLYSTTAVSLVGNGILLLLLVNKASQPIGNYRILLGAFAVTDIFVTIFHVWYIPMFILGRFGFVYFGYGCLFGNGLIAKHSNVIYSSTFYLPFLLIGMHFMYRYLSLARPSFIKNHFTRFLIFCIFYSFSFTASIVVLAISVCNMGVSSRFSGFLTEYGVRRLNSDMNIAAVEYLDEDFVPKYRAILAILGAGCVGGHSILLSIVCIHKIFKALHHRVFEIRVRRLHIQLFRSLLLQFSIPFFFSFIPFTAIAFTPFTGISLGQMGNVFGLLASLFPAIDPILIIVSISRFRSTILEWIDVITGKKAQRNEKMEKRRSQVYAAIIKPKETNPVRKETSPK